MVKVKLLFMACVLGVLTACDDVHMGEEGTFSVNCDRDPPLTYDNFGKGYMGKWCTGCHSADVREGQRNGAPLGIDLDTFDDVTFYADRIWLRSVETDGMPPGGGASAAESEALAEWLRCEVYPVQRQGGS